MSLNVTLKKTCCGSEIYTANITHNLSRMANEAGICCALWRPEEILDDLTADKLIPLLEVGLKKLKSDPEHYKKFNAPNGFGIYERFISFVEEYLEACKEHPNALISVSR